MTEKPGRWSRDEMTGWTLIHPVLPGIVDVGSYLETGRPAGKVNRQSAGLIENAFDKKECRGKSRGTG
jgi:hypothetical protein